MPVIKSARKKLKVDRKRESANKKIEALIDFVIKKARKKPAPENIREAFKAIDKGVKKNIFHKNKGARMKSQLSKLASSKPSKTKSDLVKTKGAKKTKK